MRSLLGAALATTLAACQTAGPSPMAEVRQSIDDSRRKGYERDLQARAFAEKQTSPAKGTRTCRIKQYTSAHKAKAHWEQARTSEYNFYSSPMSNVHFRIERSGNVGVAVGESTFPGLKSFFLIEGARFSADGDHYADVTAAVPSLRKDAVIKYAWHKWPYRNEINEEDAFAGFADAYEECLKFLRGASPAT